MPETGSQVILCDYPIRFDTYRGCSHACAYCFVTKAGKFDISKISAGESIKSLRNFIDGKRSATTEWAGWDIPLHWGGISDPFQPVERTVKRSHEALKVFAETKYPFIFSSKSDVMVDKDYLELLRQCNCVAQISALCPEMDKIETGAPSFRRRLEVLSILSKNVLRVIVRAQPYIMELHNSFIRQIPKFAEAGVHGITVEGMKYGKKRAGLERVGGDFCYPKKVLEGKFTHIRDECHKHGLKFYAAENRLRSMGDSLSCCGTDGLAGFKPLRYNLNHIFFGEPSKEGIRLDARPEVFTGIIQTTSTSRNIEGTSFTELMDKVSQTKAAKRMLGLST